MRLNVTPEIKNKAAKIIFDRLKIESKLNDEGTNVISKVSKYSIDTGVSDAIFKYALFSFLFNDSLKDIQNWGKVLENRDLDDCHEIERFYNDLRSELIKKALIEPTILDKDKIWFTVEGYKYYLDIDKKNKTVELFKKEESIKQSISKISLKLSENNRQNIQNDILKIIYDYCGSNKKKVMPEKELVIRYLSLLDNRIGKYLHYQDLTKSDLYDMESIKIIEKSIKEIIANIYRKNILLIRVFINISI